MRLGQGTSILRVGQLIARGQCSSLNVTSRQRAELPLVPPTMRGNQTPEQAQVHFLNPQRLLSRCALHVPKAMNLRRLELPKNIRFEPAMRKTETVAATGT